MVQALIIEGDMLIGREVSKRLAELGFDSLDHVWTEDDALVMAERHPPDLIVVGDRIQSGDGVTAARRICEMREVPVLLVTRDAFRKASVWEKARCCRALSRSARCPKRSMPPRRRKVHRAAQLRPFQRAPLTAQCE